MENIEWVHVDLKSNAEIDSIVLELDGLDGRNYDSKLRLRAMFYVKECKQEGYHPNWFVFI